MSEKESSKVNDPEATPLKQEKKQVKRYSGEKNKKVTGKLNESGTTPQTRRSRGKKQRRQFKLAPNRG
jgi:hypothetical protein